MFTSRHSSDESDCLRTHITLLVVDEIDDFHPERILLKELPTDLRSRFRVIHKEQKDIDERILNLPIGIPEEFVENIGQTIRCVCWLWQLFNLCSTTGVVGVASMLDNLENVGFT